MTTVGLAIICHQRPDELDDALNSASGQPWAEIIVLDMASNPVLVPRPGVTWIRSDVNLGVTAGRNRLLAAATSEVVVFLDDDAVFTDDVVEPLRTWFDQDRLAIVAFRVRRPGGGLASSEYPFRGQPSDDRSPRECTYFVGAAFAARRSAVLSRSAVRTRASSIPPRRSSSGCA